MHWVNRGVEPARVAAIRLQFTQRWIDHFQGTRIRPTDARWRGFHDELSEVFSGICAYCEEETRGEIDHFRPVSRFPRLVYEWSNWVFACNRMKSNQWPPDGYVNPCAEDEPDRPERYFALDTASGMLIPRTGIPVDHRQRALRMINDLDLNARYHLTRRTRWLRSIGVLFENQAENSEAGSQFLDDAVDRGSALSSIARTFLEECGFTIDD